MRRTHESERARLAGLGLTYRGEEVEAMPDDVRRGRWIKFNIQDEENPDSINGEGVFGLCLSDEDKAKYYDDEYTGNLTVILGNDPLNYAGRLSWGVEVELQCHGPNRPTLAPDFLRRLIAS